MYTINGQPTELTIDALMSIAAAARYLGVTGQTIAYYIKQGRLTAVLEPGKQTARRKPRRWVLRSEVAALKQAFDTPSDKAD